MYGSDFSAFTDLDAGLTFLESDRPELVAVAQAVARRFITPRGGMFYDPAYGLDLREFISDTIAPEAVSAMCEAEARKDERVRECATTITVLDSTTWKIDINVMLIADETFSLTLSVSNVTVELLRIGA